MKAWISLLGADHLQRTRIQIAPEIRKLIFKTDKVLTFIPDTDIEQDEYFLFRVVSYHEYDSFRLSDG